MTMTPPARKDSHPATRHPASLRTAHCGVGAGHPGVPRGWLRAVDGRAQYAPRDLLERPRHGGPGRRCPDHRGFPRRRTRLRRRRTDAASAHRLPEIEEPAWPTTAPGASALTKLLAPMKPAHCWSYLLHQMVVAPILSTTTFSVAITWAATALGGLTFWGWAWFLPNKERPVGGWISRGLGVTRNGTLVEAVVFLILRVVSGVTLSWVLRGLARVHHGVAAAMLGRWPVDDLATEVRRESQARVAALQARTRRCDVSSATCTTVLSNGSYVSRWISPRSSAGSRRGAPRTPSRSRGRLRRRPRLPSRSCAPCRVGVAPSLLQDRGVVAALAALAQESDLPVTTTLDRR